MTIQSTIQKEVNRLAAEHNEGDPCPAVYIVSIYEDKLLLTVMHGGQAFSETLFPTRDMTYGLESLDEHMRSLYNRTM
jgi:hypothetical protein